MTLKDRLDKELPTVLSFKVKIREICYGDHPPSPIESEYTETTAIEAEAGGPAIYTKLKHDKTTMQTGSFDHLAPVKQAVDRNKTNHKGKLATYQRDDGKSIDRNFECEVVYKLPVDNRRPSQ